MFTRCVAALFALVSPAFAGTLHVPKDFPTIQAAVDAAQDGDTVVVSKGVYAEGVVMGNKTNVVLRGAGKPVIDATGQADGLIVDACVDCEVRGFVVRNAGTNDVLIQFSGGILLDKCRLEASVTGLKTVSSSNMTIEHNDITGQSDNGVWFSTNPALSTSVIVSNHLHELLGLGVRLEMPHIVVDRNRIDGPVEAGIELDNGSHDTTLSRNRIRGASIGGVLVTHGTAHAIERNRIEDSEIGLNVQAGTSATTLLNRITGAITSGIRIDAAGCALDGDRISASAAQGVEIDGTGNFLTNVVVSQAGQDGFVITNSGNGLSGCRALHCGEFGLSVSASGNSFIEVTAKGSGSFDLDDTAGSNNYTECSFGLVGP